ncbi:hypothetical protein HQ585_19435 [candidate division KSB1 bacterium]|nr:hypothetical protein [candidate division KSB1 bacterium]
MNTEKTWYGPAHYKIKIKGHLCDQWVDWFEDMIVTYENGITNISGKILDQETLYGILFIIWDMGLQLISSNRIKSILCTKNT